MFFLRYFPHGTYITFLPTPRMNVVWELKVFVPAGAKSAQALQGPFRFVAVLYLLSFVAAEAG
jgi:hypothetical protein